MSTPSPTPSPPPPAPASSPAASAPVVTTALRMNSSAPVFQPSAAAAPITAQRMPSANLNSTGAAAGASPTGAAVASAAGSSNSSADVPAQPQQGPSQYEQWQANAARMRARTAQQQQQAQAPVLPVPVLVTPMQQQQPLSATTLPVGARSAAPFVPGAFASNVPVFPQQAQPRFVVQNAPGAVAMMQTQMMQAHQRMAPAFPLFVPPQQHVPLFVPAPAQQPFLLQPHMQQQALQQMHGQPALRTPLFVAPMQPTQQQQTQQQAQRGRVFPPAAATPVTSVQVSSPGGSVDMRPPQQISPTRPSPQASPPSTLTATAAEFVPPVRPVQQPQMQSAAHIGRPASATRHAPTMLPAPGAHSMQFPSSAVASGPPVTEYLCVGYLGSCGSSGGLFGPEEDRSTAALVSALCGRQMFSTSASPAASSGPFAEAELRRAVTRSARPPRAARPSISSGSSPQAAVGGRRAIKLAEKRDSDSESDTEEPEEEFIGQFAALTPAVRSAQSASPARLPSPPSSTATGANNLATDVAAEDVSAPVANFAAVQLKVDCRNKLVHLRVADAERGTDAGPVGLGLGFEASLGLEGAHWASSLASISPEALDAMDAASFHAWLMNGTAAKLRAALFIFCTCHYIVVAQSSSHVEMEWIRVLRILQTLKSRLMRSFSGAATTGGNSVSAATGSTVPSTSAPPSASLSDASALYRALFSSLQLPRADALLLSRCSSPLPLCFTPALSFIVARPRGLFLSEADTQSGEGAKQAQTHVDAVTQQLRDLCAQFGLIEPPQTQQTQHGGAASSSPAASPVMAALQLHALNTSADVRVAMAEGGVSAVVAVNHVAPPHSHSAPPPSAGRLFEPSASSSRLFEPTLLSTFAAEESKGSGSAASGGDEAQRLVAPLFYLHTQRPVIATIWDELLETAATTQASSSSSSSALSSLRSALEHAISVARAQLDVVSLTLPRDFLSSSTARAGSTFSLARSLLALQQLHTWLMSPRSPCAPVLEQALAQMLHVDARFSAERCEKALAVAKKLYANVHAQVLQATAPGSSAAPVPLHYYPLAVHEQRMRTCMRLFHKLAGAWSDDSASATSSRAPLVRALGAAVPRYEARLREELRQHWLSNHRGCDALSVLHHPCALPLGHDRQQPAESTPALAAPTAHATAMLHSQRLSCHCGSSLLKLSREPFAFGEVRAALCGACCAQMVSGAMSSSGSIVAIGEQVFVAAGAAASDGRLGWNVWRYLSGYSPSVGLSALAGFYSRAARSAYLSTVLLRAPAGSRASSVSLTCGLEYECPLGHRWLADTESEEALRLGESGAQQREISVSRGFPRRDTYLYAPCVICRFLRHLAVQAASDQAAEQRQRKLLKEEKRGRIKLSSRKQQGGGGEAAGFAEPTVPSSAVRSHDRYAQIRRVWIVTPPEHVARACVSPVIRSTRPPAAFGTSASTGSGSLSSTDGGADALALVTEAEGLMLNSSLAAPIRASTASSLSSSVENPEASPSSTVGSLRVVRDNFTPSGALLGASASGVASPSARGGILPSSSFVSLELPWILMREDDQGRQHCLAPVEAKFCVSDTCTRAQTDVVT